MLGEAYKECVCSLKNIAEVPDASVDRLSISRSNTENKSETLFFCNQQFFFIRFFLAVQSRIVHYVNPTVPRHLVYVIQSVEEAAVLLGAWLLKDTRSGVSQLVTKVVQFHYVFLALIF